MGIGKVFAIVGGVLVGAVGAYNFTTTGCPLGECRDDESSADVAAVSQTPMSGCALGTDGQSGTCEDMSGCEDTSGCEDKTGASSASAGTDSPSCAAADGEAAVSACIEVPSGCEGMAAAVGAEKAQECADKAANKAANDEEPQADPAACSGKAAGAEDKGCCSNKAAPEGNG